MRLLVTIAVMAWFAVSACTLSADDTARLQAMLAGSSVVDLNGQVLSIRAVQLGPGAWTIRNGTIICLPDTQTDRRYGVFELCKGITWRGVAYPDAPLHATFEDITFAGCLTDYTDDIEVNRARCHSQGMFASAINAMNGSRPESITVRRCKFRRLAAGVQPMGTLQFKCYNCEFDQVATACIVSSVPAGNSVAMLHDVYQCRGNECGTAFDFGGDALVNVVPVARFRNSTWTNLLGRTKFAGEWNGLVYRSKFIQQRFIPNRYAGLSIPEADQVLIDGCEISGFLAGSIESSGWRSRPTVTIRGTRLSGGQIAINSSAWTHVQLTTIDDSVIPWGDSTTPASVVDTVITNPRSNEKQANLFLGGQSVIEVWNRAHGTQYDKQKRWYILPSVQVMIGSE